MSKHEDPMIRFWRKVQKTDGCWLWTGCLNRKGYGRFSLAHKTPVYAHRYSWELTYGSIPPSMKTLHRCDVPRCVRPDHLFLGTHQDNMDDMAAKGRRATHPKITDAVRTEIATRYLRGEGTQRRIAAEYGISKSRVGQIARLESEVRS